MSGFDKSSIYFARAAGSEHEVKGSRRAAEESRRATPAPARILVVEDQEDVRRMLATALQIDGHQVEEASSARDALSCLQRSRYDLVLTDYAMPGGTGTWMLREAGQQGLMEGTMALIITAHPDVREVTDIEVVTKPLDLDRFLEQVRSILAMGSAGEDVPESAVAGEGPVPSSRYLVELVLYVSSASPASIQARQNLERLLRDFESGQVKLSVCDLSRDPLAGETDRIAFTPTLVKRFPEPRMWVLGNLKEPQVVADLLRVYGVEGVG